MPWGSYTHWTEEDLHAVVIYLRHTKPIRHQIPEATAATPFSDPAALEEPYGAKGLRRGKQLRNA
jgi:hypothetical protein